MQISASVDERACVRACVLGYLAHRAAVGEATFGESDDFTRRVVAHNIEVMLQRRVFGSLEVNQLSCLVHPNLRTGRTLHKHHRVRKTVCMLCFKQEKNQQLILKLVYS